VLSQFQRVLRGRVPFLPSQAINCLADHHEFYELFERVGHVSSDENLSVADFDHIFGTDHEMPPGFFGGIRES
jgi:hypothetical protein